MPAYLEEEAHTGPRQRCVNRVVLHDNISNIFEQIEPFIDLLEDLAKCDMFSTASSIAPLLANRFGLLLFHYLEKLVGNFVVVDWSKRELFLLSVAHTINRFFPKSPSLLP